MSSTPSEITLLLSQYNRSNPESVSTLMSAAYEEFRRIARRLFSKERRGHTLEPTAVANEAVIRLMKTDLTRCRSYEQFVGWIANTMHKFLIDYARAHNAYKRAGKYQRVEPTEDLMEKSVFCLDPTSILAVDAALKRLEKSSPLQARIVKLRVFAGCPVHEVAKTLRMGKTKVEEQWCVAKARLREELE